MYVRDCICLCMSVGLYVYTGVQGHITMHIDRGQKRVLDILLHDSPPFLGGRVKL